MMRRSLILSFVEQGLASLAMLALTAGVIATSTPDVFGQFAFAVTLVMIAASLQYGLVGVPILVDVSPLAPERQAAALRTLYAFDIYYRLAAALMVGAAALAASHDVAVAAAASSFALTYLWRETTRNTLFATGCAGRAAAMAAVGLALLLALLGVAFEAADRLTPAAPLAAAALAQGAVLVLFSRYRIDGPGTPAAAYRAYRTRFASTGWTLANSAANEIQTRSHVVAVQLFRGADQVGLIEAARVLFAPLLLVSGAWQRVVQPRLAVLVSAGNVASARWLTLSGVTAVCALSLIYCGLLALAFDAISERLFGDRFGDVTGYAVAWAIYATLLVANWTLVSFMKAMRAFRQVATIAATAALATALLLVLLAFDVPLIVALAVPVAVQGAVFLVLLIALWTVEPGTHAADASVAAAAEAQP